MDKSLSKRALGGFGWILTGTGAQAVVQILVLAALARLLTPTDFGLVAAALVVVKFSELFSELGIGPSIIQLSQLEDRHLRVGFSVSLLFSAALAAVIFALAPAFASFFRLPELAPVLRAMVLVFPLHGLAVVGESLLTRELKFRQLAWMQAVSHLGGSAIGIGLAFLSYGVWALVAATLTQGAINTALLFIVQPFPKRPMYERATFRELIFSGGAFTATRILNYLALQGDNFVVGRWLGASALGMYGRAYSLMITSVTLFGKPTSRVLFPAMAKVQNEPERLATAYRRGVALIALIILPASAAIFALAPEMIRVLLGPAWDEVVVPFQILTAGMLFRTSYKVSGALVLATGSNARRIGTQFIYAALVIGGALIGQRWGIAGVAAGVLAALTANFFLMARISLSITQLKWREFFAAHVAALALAAVVGIEAWICATLLRSLSAPAIIVLLVAVLVNVLTLLAALRLVPRLAFGQDGLWMLQTLVGYVPTRFTFARRLKKNLESVLHTT